MKNLTHYLCNLHTKQDWWYGIENELSSPHSFSRIIGIETPETWDVLELDGWAYQHGKSSQWSVKRKVIDSLVKKEPSWAGNIEYNVSKVSMKDQVYLRIGNFYSKGGLVSSLHAQNNLVKSQEVRPPLLRESNLRAFHSTLDIYLENEEEKDGFFV